MPKTIFITGGSSGIGAATARAAADAGWNVAVMARSAERLARLRDDLGGSVLIAAGDVTHEDDLRAAMDAAATRFGAIDAVFANAGRGLGTPGTEAGSPDEWRALMEVNVMGVLLTARVALPHLRRTKGTLVLTGSAAGKRHIAGSIYGATKWFVHGYAGNMAEEMREWGGRCAVVAPGMVDTAFFDNGAPDKLQPADVAEAVMLIVNAPPRASIREVHLMPQN